MVASSAQVASLVRYHTRGDDDAFRTVALQVAAKEARAGHNRVAGEIQQLLEEAPRKNSPRLASVTRLPGAGDTLDELTEYSEPSLEVRDLVADVALTAQLQRLIAERRHVRTLERHGFAPAHRFLLEGPPGTGKTMTARVIAGELNLPLRTVRLDTLFSRYMGQTAGKLRTVFEAADRGEGVYLFDEVDALAADRAGNDVGEARRILNSLLVFLEESSSRSIIIAATNHRSLLDRAMFRRFDDVLTYTLPDAAQVEELIWGRLGSMVKGLDLSQVWEHADGLSHAEVLKAAEAAAKTVLMVGGDQISLAELNRQLDARKAQSDGVK